MSGNAFKALADLANRSRDAAMSLPQKSEAAPRWRGLGFMVLGENFVAPMGQITEMLEVPAYTHLPGVQPWVMGLANVRGRLLPLFDLAMYFGGHLGQQRRNRRVLILETETLFCGLVVERALGMQHFEIAQRSATRSALPESMLAHLAGAYTDANGGTWNIIDFQSLANDARFINASLV